VFLARICVLRDFDIDGLENESGSWNTFTDRLGRYLVTYGRPLFLSDGGDGAAHYWDSYEFAVGFVAADVDAEKVVLAEALFESLSE